MICVDFAVLLKKGNSMNFKIIAGLFLRGRYSATVVATLGFFFPRDELRSGLQYFPLLFRRRSPSPVAPPETLAGLR